MFKTRLVSGIILVLAALFVIGTGNDLLFFVTTLVSLVGLYEIYKVFEIEKKVLGFIGYLASILYYVLIRFYSESDVTMLFLGFLVVLMAAYVITFPKYKAEQAMASFFGFFYVAIMLSFVYQTRMLNNGIYLVGLIFLCSWGCDTCAYCVGMLIGKHKLAPKLSPKKSIEGGIGGVIGATVLGFVYASIFKGKMDIMDSSVYIIAGICAVGAIISQIGDLAASGIKRNHDIKDYGKIIPGHGGILDRFDSVIFTAPIIYYLSALWIVNV